jgi:hypothetical protein
VLREPHLAEDGRRIAKLRDDATKTKQKYMDEVAQADFRTDAEWGESVAAFCRERKLRASHFYWWKKRLRENTTTRFVGSAGGGVPGRLTGRLADRSAAAEWPEPDGRPRV